MGYDNTEGYTKTFGKKRTLTNLAENSSRASTVEYLRAVGAQTATLNKVDFLKYLEEVRCKDNEYIVEEEKDKDTKAEVIQLNRKNIENIEERASGEER
ncbi:MAG: hypothetical protein HFJ27_02645 [Clostridia bacterium]|nr:hypothetical protein [Clostridia bacterium]